MNTKRTFISDLKPGQRFRIADYGTVYVVVRVWTGDGPRTRVRYHLEGETALWEYTNVNLATAEVLS